MARKKYTPETHKHIALDYDGTIVDDVSYPQVGTPLPGAIETINAMLEAGYHINIWTCRGGLHDDVDFEQEHAVWEQLNELITHDNKKHIKINEHFKFFTDKYRIGSPKISADVYIDNNGYGMQEVNWEEIYEDFIGEPANFGLGRLVTYIMDIKEEDLIDGEGFIKYLERVRGLDVKTMIVTNSNKKTKSHHVIGSGILLPKTKEEKHMSKEKLKVYFASPLFTMQDQMFNLQLHDRILGRLKGLGLEDKVEIYLPQLNEAINDKDAYASAEDILEADCAELRDSDLMIALLDGEDSGVALETGIAHERGIPLLGLWTDSRQKGGTNQKKLDAVKEIGQNQFMYINLMLSGAYLASEGILDTQEDFITETVMLIMGLIREKEMETK